MNCFSPLGTERFRMITHARNAPYVHNRKQCVCGKRATAKQLTQYGSCAQCISTATTTKTKHAPMRLPNVQTSAFNGFGTCRVLGEQL